MTSLQRSNKTIENREFELSANRSTARDVAFFERVLQGNSHTQRLFPTARGPVLPHEIGNFKNC